MSRCLLVACCSFMFITAVFAQVPMLDSSTITMPKAKALNKCVDQNNKVTYTQFECQDTSQKAEDNWVGKTNLTYSTPQKNTRAGRMASAKFDPSKGQVDPRNASDQSGLDMLKDAMKDKSLLELFDQGIKAMMMRQDLLDSL